MRSFALLLCLGGVLSAAVPEDLATYTTTAHAAADQQLAAARARILGEQSHLLARLQAAVAANAAARARLTAADREAKAVGDELAKRIKEQTQELTLVRQLVDRAVVAARLGEAPTRALAGQPPVERVTAAIAGVAARIAALPTRLGLRLSDEAIVGRSGAVARVPVLRLGEARAIALGGQADHHGLLEHAADGLSWLVVGPPLSAATLVRDGNVAAVAFDAVGSAAHQQAAVHRTLGEWIAAGRAFIWPLILVFVVGLLITGERIVALARRRVDHRRLVQVAVHLADDDAEGARRLVQGAASPLDRVLLAGLRALGKPRETREAVVEQVLLAETAQLTRGLSALAVLAGVAPLLGLLGTVTGMIDMFSVIAAQGSGNAKSLSGGISEALICTQAGMLVAIPLLLAHAWLGRLADRRSHLLEEAACGVLGLSEHGDRTAVIRPAVLEPA